MIVFAICWCLQHLPRVTIDYTDTLLTLHVPLFERMRGEISPSCHCLRAQVTLDTASHQNQSWGEADTPPWLFLLGHWYFLLVFSPSYCFFAPPSRYLHVLWYMQTKKQVNVADVQNFNVIDWNVYKINIFFVKNV